MVDQALQIHAHELKATRHCYSSLGLRVSTVSTLINVSIRKFEYTCPLYNVCVCAYRNRDYESLVELGARIGIKIRERDDGSGNKAKVNEKLMQGYTLICPSIVAHNYNNYTMISLLYFHPLESL